MTSRVQRLITLSNDHFDGIPWLGEALMPKLRRIDFNLVNKKMRNSDKSIAIIVQHIINWRVFTLEKLKGNHAFDIEMNSPKDWTDIFINDKKAWDELLNDLVKTQHQLIQILSNQDNDQLLDQTTPGKTYNYDYLINGVIQHDTYHSGQIGLLHAQLRSLKKT